MPAAGALTKAFLWSAQRTVTKTATVSLHGNTYQVESALAGRRVELVFFALFNLEDIEIRYQDKSYGKAVPHHITRHAHPKARPETPETTTRQAHRDRLPRDDRRHPPPTGRRERDDQLRRPLPPARPAHEMVYTTSTCGCCAIASTASRAGAWSTAASRATNRAPSGSRSSRAQLEGLPILRVIVTHMHPDHIGLADWLCKRWNAPLWISATDYHVARVLSTAGDTLAGGGCGGRLLRRARPGRRRRAGQGPPAHRLLQRIGALGAGQLRAPARRRRRRHRRAQLALHRRLRPRARAHRAVLRGGGPADRRRHDAAAHLDQRQRARRRAGVQSAAAVPRQHRAIQRACRRTRWRCPRTASPSPACTAASGSCRSTTATGWPSCWRPASRGRTAPPRRMPILFKRKLDLHQTTFAMGETIAHLHLLWFEGQLQRSRGADGVWRFGARG